MGLESRGPDRARAIGCHQVMDCEIRISASRMRSNVHIKSNAHFALIKRL
jgi:hypothetical protein